MLHILLVSVRGENIRAFTKGLSSDPEVCLNLVTSGAEALNIVRAKCPDLVIVDSGYPDTDSLGLVREIISANAMANIAVVSPLSEADFHDRSEGLGVLCRLPPEPGGFDSKALLQKLRGVLGLVNQLSNEPSVKEKQKPFSGVRL